MGQTAVKECSFPGVQQCPKTGVQERPQTGAEARMQERSSSAVPECSQAAVPERPKAAVSHCSPTRVQECSPPAVPASAQATVLRCSTFLWQIILQGFFYLKGSKLQYYAHIPQNLSLQREIIHFSNPQLYYLLTISIYLYSPSHWH